MKIEFELKQDNCKYLSKCLFRKLVQRRTPSFVLSTTYFFLPTYGLSCDSRRFRPVCAVSLSPLRNIKVSQCKSLKIPINFPSFLLTPVQPLNLTFQSNLNTLDNSPKIRQNNPGYFQHPKRKRVNLMTECQIRFHYFPLSQLLLGILPSLLQLAIS